MPQNSEFGTIKVRRPPPQNLPHIVTHHPCKIIFVQSAWHFTRCQNRRNSVFRERYTCTPPTPKNNKFYLKIQKSSFLPFWVRFRLSICDYLVFLLGFVFTRHSFFYLMQRWNYLNKIEYQHKSQRCILSIIRTKFLRVLIERSYAYLRICVIYSSRVLMLIIDSRLKVRVRVRKWKMNTSRAH